jgi:hypothetical protein
LNFRKHKPILGSSGHRQFAGELAKAKQMADSDMPKGFEFSLAAGQSIDTGCQK